MIKFLWILILTSCAMIKIENYKRPLMRHTERELYIVDVGWDLRTEEKLAFIDGKIIPGMKVHHLLLIYGEPDLSMPCPKGQSQCDRIWVYSTNNTFTVGSVSIKDTLVVGVSGQMSQSCKY